MPSALHQQPWQSNVVKHQVSASRSLVGLQCLLAGRLCGGSNSIEHRQQCCMQDNAGRRRSEKCNEAIGQSLGCWTTHTNTHATEQCSAVFSQWLKLFSHSLGPDLSSEGGANDMAVMPVDLRRNFAVTYLTSCLNISAPICAAQRRSAGNHSVAWTPVVTNRKTYYGASLRSTVQAA